jgi:hypothetical protein
VNDTVQRYTLGEIRPDFVELGGYGQGIKPEIIPLSGLSDSDLLNLSQERRLALDLQEMREIQGYFLRCRPASNRWGAGNTGPDLVRTLCT